MSIEQNEQNDPTTSRRFGSRADIDQPATLTIGDRAISGVISNVGLRGAFFSAQELPAPGAAGTLTRDGGRGVDVWVVWQRGGEQSGVGLSFDAPA